VLDGLTTSTSSRRELLHLNGSLKVSVSELNRAPMGTPKGKEWRRSDTSVCSFALVERPDPPELTVPSLVERDRAES
jgi:hypothetical protein